MCKNQNQNVLSPYIAKNILDFRFLLIKEEAKKQLEEEAKKREEDKKQIGKIDQKKQLLMNF